MRSATRTKLRPNYYVVDTHEGWGVPLYMDRSLLESCEPPEGDTSLPWARRTEPRTQPHFLNRNLIETLVDEARGERRVAYRCQFENLQFVPIDPSDDVDFKPVSPWRRIIDFFSL